MRYEDVAQCRQSDPCEHELSRDAVTAIDDVRHSVHDDHLRRRRACPSRPRAAPSAKQDQSSRAGSSREDSRDERATEKRGCRVKEPSPGAAQRLSPVG